MEIKNGKFVLPMEDVEISKATLRYEDLLQTYNDILNNAYVFPPFEDVEWWESDDPIFLMEDMLNNIAEKTPDTHVFRSHEGNSSLIGFWLNREGEEL